jgi:hypothetical protein
MFLGGSYHDRDNPHSNKASHGKSVVWKILVCSQTEGRQRSGSRRGLRTLVNLMMMTMIFYGGTGTKCTAVKIVTRNRVRRWSTTMATNNNNKQHSPQATRSDQTTRSTWIDLCKATPPLQRRPTMADKATRKEQDVPLMMNDGSTSTTPTDETRDGGPHGDLHQGRMEDDEDGGSPMPSATGTLDRKTSQASPTTCLLHREQPTRSINKDKACRCHREDAKDGCTRLRTPRRMLWTRTTTQPDRKDEQEGLKDDDDEDDDGRQLQDGTDWKITNKRTPCWYWMTRVRPIITSPLSAVR